MKILITGPSGVGKTYVSTKLKEKGVNAVDADKVEGLSAWYSKGKNVNVQGEIDKDFLENHEFLWDREFLNNYLNAHPTIYLFGSSGNMFELLDLFDKVFFLHIPSKIQKKRLVHSSRENPLGKTEFQRNVAVEWGQYMEKLARERNIPLLDATMTPEEILQAIEA